VLIVAYIARFVKIKIYGRSTLAVPMFALAELVNSIDTY